MRKKQRAPAIRKNLRNRPMRAAIKKRFRNRRMRAATVTTKTKKRRRSGPTKRRPEVRQRKLPQARLTAAADRLRFCNQPRILLRQCRGETGYADADGLIRNAGKQE